MQKKDMPEVVAAINGLCDLFVKPKPTVPAIEHWWEAIKEFPLHNVLLILNTWARDSSKMPMPHDVWERLNNMRTAELEEKARAEKEAEKRAPITAGRTDYGRRMLRAIKEELAMQGPKDHKAWAKRILDRSEAGEAVPAIAVQVAQSVAGKQKEAA